MQAVAHNPSFAKRVDVPQSVGREFVNADRNADKRKALVNGLRKPSAPHKPATGGVRG
jgi:hypothetical protein